MNKLTLAGTIAALPRLSEALEKADHRTVTLWAIDVSEEVLPLFCLRVPSDPRPGAAINAARAWSRGEVRMPFAKRACLGVHAAARSLEDKAPAACAAAHAIGQAVGVVHTKRHAMGVAAYAVNAMLYNKAPADLSGAYAEAEQWLLERLRLWEAFDKSGQPWASFYR